jgi:hypothetical protein
LNFIKDSLEEMSDTLEEVMRERGVDVNEGPCSLDAPLCCGLCESHGCVAMKVDTARRLMRKQS